jgi:glutathione S-transferase
MKQMEGNIMLYFGALEKKLKENVVPFFFVGKKYSVADFLVLGCYVHILSQPDWAKVFVDLIKAKLPVLHAYLMKRLADFNPYFKKCDTHLHYFDIAGRGEMIRVMLKHLKLPFHDDRIKMADWGALKTSGKFELQQVPVVECEPCGVSMCQSDAIMHRIGARYGLLPLKCPEKLQKVVWWCNVIKDAAEGAGRIQFQLNVPEEKKKELRAEYFAKAAPAYFDAMEEKLKSNKTQCFLVGKKYTIADFYLIGAVRGFFYAQWFPEHKLLFDSHPTLLAYFENQNTLF